MIAFEVILGVLTGGAVNALKATGVGAKIMAASSKIHNKIGHFGDGLTNVSKRMLNDVGDVVLPESVVGLDGKKYLVKRNDLMDNDRPQNMKMDGKDSENTYNNPEEPYKNGYKLKEGIDLDWRGTGKTVKDALEHSFQRVEDMTGVKKADMDVTKWGIDENSKSLPVEWKGFDSDGRSVEVNIDYNHTTDKTLNAPHVGYKFGKRETKEVGHIILDSVPVGRIDKKQ